MGRERLRQYAPEERTAPQRRPKKKPANQAPDHNGLIQAQPANPTPIEELRYDPAPFERIVAKISANGEGAKPAIARKPLSEQLIGPVPQREPDPAATSRSSNELGLVQRNPLPDRYAAPIPPPTGGLVQRNPLPDRYAAPMPAPTGGLVQRHPIPDRYAAPLPPIQAKLIVGPAKDRYADPAFLATGKPPIQAKLMVGPAKDRYEQEADQVASQVVQTINNPDTNSVQREDDDLSLQPQETLQRQDDEDEDLQMKPEDSIQREEDEEEELQMKPEDTLQREEEEEEEDLQMKPQETLQRVGSDGGAISSDLETEIQQAKGSGQPLDTGLQRSMGQAMGADFSNVKIHADSQADQLNRSIQAKAFTTGQDVFFRQGNYNPGSQGGQELIAHELTHVVQQGGAETSGQLQRFSLLDQDILQRDDDDDDDAIGGFKTEYAHAFQQHKWPAQHLNRGQDKTRNFEVDYAYAFQKEAQARNFEAEPMLNAKHPNPNFGDVKVGADVPDPVMFPGKQVGLEDATQQGAVSDIESKIGKVQVGAGNMPDPVMFPGKQVGMKDAEQYGAVKDFGTAKIEDNTSPFIGEARTASAYSQLYQSKSLYYEIQNHEIPAYFRAIAALEPKSTSDYFDMTSEKLMKMYPDVLDKSIVPHCWASGYDPSSDKGFKNASSKAGKLIPVIWPENVKASTMKVFRGDSRPPWDASIQNFDGFAPWSISKGASLYSKNIIRHIIQTPSPDDSAYISTTKNRTTASSYAVDNAYIYDFTPQTGIYIPNCLSGYDEGELSVSHTIPMADITRIQHKKARERGVGYKTLAKVVANNAWDSPLQEIKNNWKHAQLNPNFTWKDYLTGKPFRTEEEKKLKADDIEEKVIDYLKSQSIKRMERYIKKSGIEPIGDIIKFYLKDKNIKKEQVIDKILAGSYKEGKKPMAKAAITWVFNTTKKYFESE